MPEPINPKERRLVLCLLDRWRELCGERDLPRRDDVDGQAIGDMWDYCFVIDLNEPDPRFAHFGAWHAEFHGRDLTGQPLRTLAPATLAAYATRYLPEILRRRVPLSYGGELMEEGGRRILYRSILMPLSDGGEALVGVLGGANCRVLPPEEA